VYTTVPPAQQRAPNRFILRQERAAADQSGAWLPGLMLAAGVLLDFHWSPAALWNVDHTECLFNRATSALFGFSDKEFCADKDLWLKRIDGRDRAAFLSSWKDLQNGQAKMTCRYRFMPRHGALGIDLEETALLLPAGKGARRAVLSLYRSRGAAAGQQGCKEPGRSPMQGLIHQIGNNLQAIHGEAELARLFDSLPQRSFDKIAQGIDSIQELIAQIHAISAREEAPLAPGTPERNALPDDDNNDE